MNHEDIAVQKRNHGYNCSQAVACTYCDILDIDEVTAFKLTEGFGSGLGSTLGTCGALNAIALIISMQTSTGNLEQPNSKGKTYPVIKKITNEFQNEVGALRCRDIKGIESGKILCECEECVRVACRILDRYLETSSENQKL